jgi:hypothetical protein
MTLRATKLLLVFAVVLFFTFIVLTKLAYYEDVERAGCSLPDVTVIAIVLLLAQLLSPMLCDCRH